ncbi:MAG: ECF-type sigma factor [Pirellulales bacterium]|nr:ECF-type sigma factor [Pirellulales bacterium]
MSTSSITVWLEGLAKGDSVAAQEIWNRFFTRLVEQCRLKLRDRVSRGIMDEEDIAISAFESFCRGAEQQKFSQLNDRSDVWQILLVLAERKAVNAVRYHSRLKRGAFRVRNISEFDSPEDGGSPMDIADAEPLPDFVVAVTDEFKYLIGLLKKHDQLYRVAMLKLENHSNAEIAKCIGKTVRTVEYKLKRIKELWKRARPTD